MNDGRAGTGTTIFSNDGGCDTRDHPARRLLLQPNHVAWPCSQRNRGTDGWIARAPAGLNLCDLGVDDWIRGVTHGRLKQMVLDLLAHMFSLLAGIPGAMWHVASPAVLAMVAFYVLLVMAVAWEGNNVLSW